jgi:hypothetical protein
VNRRAEPLAIELKLSLDRWCKGEFAASAQNSSAPTRHGGSHDANLSRSSASTSTAASGRQLQRSASLYNNSGNSFSQSSGGGRTFFSGFSMLNASKEPAGAAVTESESSQSQSETSLAAFLSRTAATILPMRGVAGAAPRSSTQTGTGATDSTQRIVRAKSVASSALPGGDVLAGNNASNSPPPSPPRSARLSLKAKSRSSDSIDVRASSALGASAINSGGAGNIRVDATGNAAHSEHHALLAKDRTWAYHAVMSVVAAMQKDHSVPIVVFI